MKRFCRNCRYYHARIEIDEGVELLDVCGHGILTEKDEVGRETLKDYEGRIILPQCAKRNRRFQCEHFTPKWYLRFFYKKDGAKWL